MATYLYDQEVWISHLLEKIPEEKLSHALADNDPEWEYIDGEIVKLGSLAHSQLDIPEIQRRGLKLLASESKDFRLLAHLLRTLQHSGHLLLALRLLTLYVEHFWAVSTPNMLHRKRFATQVVKRFEAGVPSFAKNTARTEHNALLGELAKLAQSWQVQLAPELAQATDELFTFCQRTFCDATPAILPSQNLSESAPQTFTTYTQDSGRSQKTVTADFATPFQQINVDSRDDMAWRDTLLNVAAVLCERQPDSPLGYRLRRHALWQTITTTPTAESDGRTPMAAISADMAADYLARLTRADITLWQLVEKSLLLAPYWLDGHYLSAQVAQRLGYRQAAEAIRDEVSYFLDRLPALADLLFNDRTPFMNEQTKQWLASPSSPVQSIAQHSTEELQVARAYSTELGLEAALRYLDTLPEGDPRDQFYRQYFGAQLIEEAGMIKLAQQQYRMLFNTGSRMALSEWEPSLLEMLEQKFTAEQ